MVAKLIQTNQSRLVPALAIGFIIIVLIDLTFIGVLSVQTMKTEAQAAREVRLIRASQRISTLAKYLLAHRRLLDSTALRVKESRDEYHSSVNRIRVNSNSLVREWNSAGLPTDEVRELATIVNKMCKDSDTFYSDGASSSARQTAYLVFGSDSNRLYTDAMSRMQRVHELILAEKAPDSSFDPLTLFLVAAGMNLAVCVFAGYLIITRVTGPISRLANACGNLMVGTVIPASTSNQAQEIRTLEATFHEMSSIVAEADNSRINFLKQMQDVQEVSLQNVKAYVDQLSESPCASSPNTKETFNMMRTNVQGMLFLLSSMTYGLNFSPDDIVLKYSRSSTTGLLNATSKTVTWLMKRKKIKLIIEDPEVKLDCDVHLIERVIVNLLSNASKFSENGSEICLTATQFQDDIQFSVRDSGCGISVENQEKLFQKFSQVEAVDGMKRSGSGLGLLICKGIVEAHGGEIGCESTENEGSTFWFTLPFQVQKAPEKKEEYSETNKQSRYGGKYSRILVLVIVGYALCQTALAFNLAGKYQFAKETASKYSRQKDLIIGTQDLLGTFLTWRQKTLEAMRSGDIESFMDMHPLLKQQNEKVARLLAVAEPDSPTQDHLRTLNTNLSLLIGIADDAIDKVDVRRPNESGGEFKAAGSLVTNIEHTVFAILKGERNVLDSSADLGRKLRDDIIFTAELATLVNLVALIIVFFIGFSLVRKIDELNSKALQFAFGGDLTRTISGNDELAFLDQQLCDVAQKVRTGQRQRQDLMAIINHDLRTPLGAFLNGLEILSSGMLGTLSNEEEQLVKQAESDVQGVLLMIDDFLSTEKETFEAGLMSGPSLVTHRSPI